MLAPTLQVARKLAFSSSVNVVWAGNSLVAGLGSNFGVNDVATQVSNLPPMAGSGCARSNFGISGQSWEQMQSGSQLGSIASAWAAGKTNVLILWETTNSVWNTPESGMTAIAACQSFIAAVRAAHPWIIVCLTTLPRDSATTTATTTQAVRDSQNAQMDIADNYMRANFYSIGIDRLVDVRQAGSPFVLPDYTQTSFDALPYWNEASGYQIHLNPTGYGVVAGYVAAVLKRLPRAPRAS